MTIFQDDSVSARKKNIILPLKSENQKIMRGRNYMKYTLGKRKVNHMHHFEILKKPNQFVDDIFEVPTLNSCVQQNCTTANRYNRKGTNCDK